MGHATTEFLEARALAGSGLAASLLLRQAARAKVRTFDQVRRSWRLIVALAVLACDSPSADLRERAVEVVARKWDAAHPSFQVQVIQTWQGASATSYDRYHPRPDVPPEVARFVVAHLGPYLASEPTSVGLTMLTKHADVILWGAEPRGVAEWLVDALVFSTDDRAVRDLHGLLATTEQPELLEALEQAFASAVSRHVGVQGYRESEDRDPRPLLWRAGRPTLLTEVLVANPRLPLPLPPSPLPFGFARRIPRVLLLVLKGQVDLLPEYVTPELGAAMADALNDGAGLEAAPDEFVAGCRTALRQLPPGPAREQLCVLALSGRPEALSAVVDAEVLPADPEEAPAFLFCTEQWERYDRVDPDGRRLRAWCAVHAARYHGRRNYRMLIESAARRSGRPDPCPPLPVVRTTSRGSSRAGGSYHTDPSGGGFDGGGGYGGFSGGVGGGY